MFKALIGILILISTYSCTNDMKDVNALIDKKELLVEIAKDVEILYSDSAIVRMKITAPELHRHLDKTSPTEEWPLGVHVDFYDLNKNPTAWLDAKYAIRIPKENLIITRDSVVLHNQKGDILESPELRYDQKKEILFTDKFVRIIQVQSQDTMYGIGFETDKEFKRFEIKNKFSTIQNITQ